MKISRNSGRNRQFLTSWLTASVVVVAMLLLMFLLVQASNDPTADPDRPGQEQTGDDDIPVYPIDTPPPVTESTTLATTTTTAAPTTTTQSTTTTTVQKTESNSCTITAEYANVRTGAGAGYEYVARVYSGERYVVLGEDEAANGILWYKIDLGNGKKGYVCASFVTFSGDVPDASQEPVPGGKAYLTFDDGPSKNTSQILDILDRYGVKATFFVMYNRGQDDMYREIVERGHTIALHTYSHTYADLYASEEAFFADLKKISDHVESLTGVRSMITRFPGGSSNTVSHKHCEGIMTKLTAGMTERGYAYFDWNVDSGDADGTTVPADTLIANIKNRTGSRKQVVILMHDARSKTTTVEALPAIIEYLQSRGYEILPITEDTEPVHHRVNN